MTRDTTDSPELPVSASLDIRLLGSPEWAVDQMPAAMADPRAAVLVAMIVLDGALPRTRAAETFWPQSEGKARTNLRVLLHRVQHAIGTRLFGAGDRLTLLPHVTVDLAGTDTQIVDRCLQLGSSNIQLLDGVDLGDLPEASRWLSEARRQVAQRVVRSHVAWLESHRSPDHLAQAAAVADSLVSIDSLSEIGYREQMRIHAERGDRAGALAAFEHCRRELKQHLGTSPDPQTTALHRSILRVRDEGGAADGAPAPRPLLQREQELADMDKALAARRIVIVEGPSGSGKTALLRQFARQRSDFYWAVESSDSAAPLAGLVRIASHVAQLARASGDDTLPPVVEFLKDLQRRDPDGVAAIDLPSLARGAASAAAVLQHAGHRAVVIDDVHLLDDLSLDVLAHIVHASWELMPWCDFVLAYRPVRARRKVRALCEKLALDGRLRLVHPGMLRREAALALMAHAGTPAPHDLAAADRLVAMSGGTPGVIVELIALQAPVTADSPPASLPPQIRSILLERLRSCSSTADGLAQLASVAGTSFSVGLAATIAGLSSWKVAEKWNELLLAGVFDARGFAFPLMELAVRASVPDAVRQFMHGEVAKALEREGAPPERLAGHWQQAGDMARAAPFARAAAAACLQAGHLDDAIAALERMVLTPGGACAEGDTVALLQLAALYLQADRPDRVPEALEAAARTPASTLERGARTALGGRTLLAMREYGAASAALSSALPLVEGDAHLLRSVQCWATRAAQLAGDPVPANATRLPDLVEPFVWDPDGIPVHTPLDGQRCLAELQAGA
jgi:DNA-binding SARP family transcriptional activator